MLLTNGKSTIMLMFMTDVIGHIVILPQMLLADVNAMWLMAINVFVSDVVDTCFVDNESTLRY